jgi:hypothetical protein
MASRAVETEIATVELRLERTFVAVEGWPATAEGHGPVP